MTRRVHGENLISAERHAGTVPDLDIRDELRPRPKPVHRDGKSGCKRVGERRMIRMCMGHHHPDRCTSTDGRDDRSVVHVHCRSGVEDKDICAVRE